MEIVLKVYSEKTFLMAKELTDGETEVDTQADLKME
jgi:hypothetical protein